jgi:hypothetical protein
LNAKGARWTLVGDFAPPPSTVRLLHDGRELVADGVHWFIYELPPTAFDCRESTSLVFDSEKAVRRVRNFPKAWRALSDEALMASSWEV